jgi:radical SAM protein with 4Fe4S-binding SPASM domain
MSLSSPYDFVIQWHLTERCNLRCRHCYQEGSNYQEMSFPLISSVIDEIFRMFKDWQEAYDLEFAPSFNVTGGEPFLRPDFFAILEEMIGAGFDCYVLSNGTIITQERAQTLADLGVKGVQVSLEGPEGIHDAIRGRGSFRASLEGVKNLLAAEVNVSLNATLSRVNAAAFMELAGIAASMGVAELGYSRLVPSGQGQAMLTQMLELKEVKTLYEEIASLKVKDLKLVTGDPMAAQMSSPPEGEDLGDTPAGGCAAGVAGLTILADGTISPCRRLPIPLGRAGEDSLREIWATAPVLEQLRDRSQYRGKCGSCKRWSVCRGCRAIAYAYARAQGNADFLGPDPQCFIASA